METKRTKHTTYKIGYHMVWCPRYRKDILKGKIASFVEEEIRRLCDNNQWTIGALQVQEDHVHLLVSAPPAIAPSQIANTLKGITARQVFKQFPEIKKQSWDGHFWSRSFLVVSGEDIDNSLKKTFLEEG